MTSIRRLGPADRAQVDDFLTSHRASSMFLRSNIHHAELQDGVERYQGLYVGAFDGDRLTDIGAHYWNGHIILQAPTLPAEIAVAAAQDSGRSVNGILGPWAQVKTAEPHVDLDRSRLGKVVPEHLYMLNLESLKVPKSLSQEDVQHRFATVLDLLILVAWRRVYDRITMGFPDHAIDDVRNRDMLAGMIEEQRLWVLEVNGAPVAVSTFSAVLPDTVQVGGVFTDESHRGRGFARSVVAATLIDARQSGVVDAILFTEADNFSAQHAYESLGFVRAGDYGMVVLDPA